MPHTKGADHILREPARSFKPFWVRKLTPGLETFGDISQDRGPG